MTRLLLVLALTISCKTGGEYVTNPRGGGSEDEKGETNGRSLDLVSNRPEGDDWEVRIRGSSMWASHGDEEEIKQLPPVNLDHMQSEKVWRLIDELDLPHCKKGKKDEDEGFVTLVLREPGGEDQADMFTVYISRGAEDEDLEKLALYLQDLIKRYHKVTAEF